MRDTAVVSEKGQVTLPKSLRERLGIRSGSRLAFDLAPDGELRIRVLAQGAAPLFGLLAKPGEAVRSLAEMDAAVTQAVKARGGRGR